MKALVGLAVVAASCGFDLVGHTDLSAPGDLSGAERASNATHLVFQLQPHTAAADLPIGPVVVAAVDEGGQPVSDFTGTVRVALTANAADLTLRGGSLRDAVAGVATFDNLSLDGAGQSLALSANARSLGAASSDVFDSLAPAWTRANAGLDGTDVRRLLDDPLDAATVYLATRAAGVYLSSDGGGSWHTVNIGLADTRVGDLAMALDGTLYAATAGGLFRRMRGAVSWQPLDPGSGLRERAMPAVAAGTSAVYAACDGKILVSGDHGDTWTAAPSDPVTAAATLLAVSPLDDQTVFASDGSAVVQSSDGANRFARAESGLPASTVRDLWFDGAGALYAATGAGAFRLPAGGAPWSLLPSGGGPTTAVGAVASDPGTVYVSDETAGLQRVSGGASTVVLAPPHPAPTSLTLAPSNPILAHLGSDGAGAFRIAVGTSTAWSAGTGQTAAHVNALATDSAGTLFAATEGGLFRSGDRAVSFTVLPAGSEPRFDDVASSGAVTVALARGKGWSSSDGGTTWAAASGFDGCARLRFDPGDATTAYCTPFDPGVSGVYRIAMSGQSRMLLTSGLGLHAVELAIDPATTGATLVLWAGTAQGLYRSGDGGGSFTTTSIGGTVTALAAGSAAIFCATGGGASRSMDDGATWQPLDASLTGATLFTVDVHAGVYAAAASGLQRSTDGGVLFTTVGSGLGDATIRALAFDPSTALLVYAGSAGAGLFRTTTGGD